MDNKMNDIKYEEEYVLNSQEMQLFSCRWLPKSRDSKALVFLCHGYAMECSISMKGCAMRLVKAGYEVHGIDCQGHGKSCGLQGLISEFDELVDDLFQHYTFVSQKPENRNKMRILLGESMGGAMALLLHRKKPDFWHGAVLIAPMCKIADEIRPTPVVAIVLNALATLGPTWRLSPGPDLIDVAFRDPQVREEIRSNPYAYKGRTRLQTGYQLFKVCEDLEHRLDEVTLPFIVLHGEDDKVTDPLVSKALYDSAKSKDKTLKLYPGMWHSLTYGELPENLDIVFNDIVEWLDKRVVSNKIEKEPSQQN